MVHLIWWHSTLSNNPKFVFWKKKRSESTSLVLFFKNVFAHLEDINDKRLFYIFGFGEKLYFLF